MRKNGKKPLAAPSQFSRRALLSPQPVSTPQPKRLILGRYIVADPEICHGKPTFRGTRIMVWQVLSMVSRGLDWETIVERCHKSITQDAIAEAVKLSSEAFVKHSNEFVVERIPA